MNPSNNFGIEAWSAWSSSLRTQEEWLAWAKNPFTPNGEDKPPPARRSAAPVAPVTPSPGGTSGGGAEVHLTRGEAATATDGTLTWNYDDPSGQKKFKKGDPIGIQEMARRKKTMKEQGLYDKSNYEA